MGRHYSRKTFLRKTPNALLQRYFAARGLTIGVAWAQLPEPSVESIDAAMETLEAKALQEVEGDFGLVNELACAAGNDALREEAALYGLDWSDKFSSMASDHERAMWAFLVDPRKFEEAGAFYQMDRVAFGWHRFVGRRLEVSIDSEAIDQLGRGIAALYRRWGRGKHCHVDYYRRLDPERYCFFAYPEDAPRSEIGYDEVGRFRRFARQPVGEVIFVYRPEDGILDLYGRGTQQQKEVLANELCTVILRLNDLPDSSGEPEFDLSILKERNYELSSSLDRRIDSIDVRMIRLDLPFDRRRGLGRRIVLYAKSTPEAPDALKLLRAEAVQAGGMPLNDVLIGAAKFCITFKPEGNARSKSLTFEVGYPDRCTLKDDKYDQIARQCLKRMGIARAVEAEVCAASGGSA